MQFSLQIDWIYWPTNIIQECFNFIRWTHYWNTFFTKCTNHPQSIKKPGLTGFVVPPEQMRNAPNRNTWRNGAEWKLMIVISSIFSDFPPCHSGQFRCENSLCIPARWRCDGYKVTHSHDQCQINVICVVFSRIVRTGRTRVIARLCRVQMTNSIVLR